MARKRAKSGGDGPPGSPEWMGTYGDMVTLLLTFFVLLFAMSSVDNAKWNILIETFTGAPPPAIVEPIDPVNPVEGIAKSELIPRTLQRPVEDPVDASNPSQEGKETNAAVIEEEFNELYEKLENYIQGNSLEQALVASKDGMYIFLTATDGILFDSGQADITPVGQQILEDIGNMFFEAKDSIIQITVEGHTDDNKISTALFEDNWDLSVKRATNVVRKMAELTQLEMPIFEAVGYGEWRPVASNDTADGRAQNRRVRFIVESVAAKYE